jgi:hypothetical protein
VIEEDTTATDASDGQASSGDPNQSSSTDYSEMTLSDARMSKAKNKESREASLVPKFKQAVDLGLAGLHVSELVKDAPEVSQSTSTIIENEGVFYKDQRKLPFIINSAPYLQD